MSYTMQMLPNCPVGFKADAELLATTIDALNDCAQACTADTGCDLSEENVAEMVSCVQLCLECADVCITTARVISRQANYGVGVVTLLLLEACVAACMSCGDECERHAHMHEHCRFCAQACRRCQGACRDLLDALGPEIETSAVSSPALKQ